MRTGTLRGIMSGISVIIGSSLAESVSAGYVVYLTAQWVTSHTTEPVISLI